MFLIFFNKRSVYFQCLFLVKYPLPCILVKYMLCSFYLHLYDYLSLLRFWIHILMAYLFTLWTLYVLYKEYDNVAFMRLHFLASQHRRVDQFTVSNSCNVPPLNCRSYCAFFFSIAFVSVND